MGYTSPSWSSCVGKWTATVVPLTDSFRLFQIGAECSGVLADGVKVSCFPHSYPPCDGSQLSCFDVTIREHYVVVSKAWYDGGFGDQAWPVGQEDVQDGITSCWLVRWSPRSLTLWRKESLIFWG